MLSVVRRFGLVVQMSMPVHRPFAGGRGGEFSFISGGVFHLVKINKMCEGGHVKQKVAWAQKKGDHMGSPLHIEHLYFSKRIVPQAR